MMEKRELTCIGCPLGCLVTVQLEQGKVVEISGHSCKRGETYARKEVTNPTRIVTTTVQICGGTEDMLAVKTKTDVPKSKLFACVKALKGLNVNAPIELGDVVLHNVAGTGVDVVATKSVPAKIAAAGACKR